MWSLLDLLFPPRKAEETLRGVSKDTFLAFLSPKVIDSTHPSAVALFSFGVPGVRAAIHEAKYHGGYTALEYLSAGLIQYLEDSDGIGSSVLIPVPLGALRQKERGFNQVEEVVRRAAVALRRDMDTGLLIRTRETISQVSLPREKREENMRGAFDAAHPADPQVTYILVDDVTTTGATLQSAIDALKAAGATHITPIALAH